MKLTAAIARTLRAPGKYTDGHGLFLHVVDADKRYWMFRFKRARSKERVMSLGAADVVTLAEARKLHTEARALLAKGIDPLDAREAAKPQLSHTFTQAMEEFIGAHQAGWRGARSAHQWRQTLVAYAVPVFGPCPVDQITTEDVLRVLQPIWIEKAVTAAKVRNRVELVLSYAKARKWRSGENPAAWRDNLQLMLPSHAKVRSVEHRAFIPWQEAPRLMRKLTDETSMPARCLSFLVLTGVRSAEARGAQWSEIDLAGRLWAIPAARTKTAKEHRVPLSEAAMEILSALAEVRTKEPLIFLGSVSGRPMADTTLRDLLMRLGYQCSVHGMRSVFRSWAADRGEPADLCEVALGHVVGGKVQQAYHRTDMLEARRRLMADWADFLAQPAAEVIPLRGVA
jgi:integrase